MNNETQSLQIMRKLTANFDPDNKKPSQIVGELWEEYQSRYDSNNNLNGALFEEIIGYILTLTRCMPFYMQAKVAYVPNVNYDFILATSNRFDELIIELKERHLSRAGTIQIIASNIVIDENNYRERYGY